MENIGLGLELMLIGMSCVFVVLILVILLGRLLIAFTGWLDTAPVPAKEEPVSAETRAILDAAVRELTRGEGRISNIVKL